MSIRVALNHKTEYHFDRLVQLSPHIVRLWPAPHCRTPILSRSIKITPETHFLNWQQDPYSNYLARLVFPELTKSLTIEIDIITEMINVNPFDFFIEEYAGNYPFAYEKTLAKELVPYFETLPVEPTLKAWLEQVSMKKVRTIDFVVALNQRIQSELKYLIRMEPGVQTPEETLTLKSGSCRDFAWLLVQVLRNCGLAARFVSGYSIQLVADVPALDGPSGTSVDCCDLHAWAEVFLPGAGWIGLDATCGMLAGSGYIPLAATAEPSTAAPVSGAINTSEKVETDFKVTMSVTRIHEDVRVTKPYSDAQWSEIEALGHTIDESFACDDVKMTMGGEPTFVSIDYPNDPEWNTLAVGPRKRRLAGTLLKRLRDRFAVGGFLHYGQGKWYPGESLPRWALGCYWRKDGVPIWTDPALVADEAVKYDYTEAHAGTFIKALASRLRVEPEFAIPGYEDAWHYLLQERKFPINVDPLQAKLTDPEERKRLARILDQGLAKIVGYALPLQRRWIDGVVKWVSGAWYMRREHMYLIPGDSSMGFRLPLDSLPWVRDEDREMHTELDPFNSYLPLPSRVEFQTAEVPAPFRRGAAPDELRSRGWPTGQTLERTMRWPKRSALAGRGTGGISAADIPVPYNASGEPLSDAELKRLRYDIVRTALCVEARGGFLYVFMPPQYCLEDYLNLITAVEDTARELKLPVLVEGYTPPHDPRLQVMKVTPDPGVIEVNIHPAKNWDELVTNTRILYEEARLSRLTTEKFMIDGRHTGTGGGNHIVIGGETSAESPLLRRPDVLRSLLSFWHNHPSLSFLFSGMFIGPTSQHPRIDEARNDSVFELELAFKQIPAPDKNRAGCTAPWLVDRVLRNLLIDASGNTHRTEFCIDKLYSPDSSSGRLGLLELRSFEMPPHWRMSLAQQLLMRALVAKFWERPYTHRLVRWGTELHDRFMLPHFVEQDFNDVIEELCESGIAMKAAWFAPHLEFRFPFYGEVAQRGVRLELRQALEPWHVLGEEPGPGGTVRFVDSSVERIQLKVQGMTAGRHIAACNGRRIPLHPTGTNGEFVAGVRYRAWQPPNCLHPTIPVHAPLVIDLIDTWNGRSIGGCSYHVSHPGGRSFETFPVNAYEAESRRVARYFPHGHTPGEMQIPECEKTREFPFTLDMRIS